MFAGRDYDPTLLIDRVTQKMVEVENALKVDEARGEQHFCGEWLPVLLSGGLIKRQ
jgi:hypothetical protein